MKKGITLGVMVMMIAVIISSCHKDESEENFADNFNYFPANLHGRISDGVSPMANGKVYVQLFYTQTCDGGPCPTKYSCTVDSTTTDVNGYYNLDVNLKNACEADVITIAAQQSDSVELSVSSQFNSLTYFPENGYEMNLDISN